MPMSTYFGGITIKIFNNLEQDYLEEFNNTLKDVSDHTHNGSGAGNPIHGTTAIQAGTITADSIADGTITSDKLATAASVGVIANASYLKWRNAANSADLNTIRVNSSNHLELEQDIDKARLSNNIVLKGATAASVDFNIFKINTSDHWEFLNTAYSQDILPKTTATYTLGDSTHLFSNAYMTNIRLGDYSTSTNFFASGTWTPVIAGGTAAGSGTYTTQVGNYIRLGNLVIASCELVWTAHTGTGNLRVQGIPFNIAGSTTYSYPSSVYVQNQDLTGIERWNTLARVSSTSFEFISIRHNTTAVAMAMDSAATLTGTLIYFTS